MEGGVHRWKAASTDGKLSAFPAASCPNFDINGHWADTEGPARSSAAEEFLQ